MSRISGLPSKAKWQLSLGILVIFALLVVFSLGPGSYAGATSQNASTIAQRSGDAPRPVATEPARFVNVCHSIGSPHRAYVELRVAGAALPAHLRHGDLYPVPEGGCPSGVPTPIPTP